VVDLRTFTSASLLVRRPIRYPLPYLNDLP